jgi:hypothetical protein
MTTIRFPLAITVLVVIACFAGGIGAGILFYHQPCRNHVMLHTEFILNELVPRGYVPKTQGICLQWVHDYGVRAIGEEDDCPNACDLEVYRRHKLLGRDSDGARRKLWSGLMKVAATAGSRVAGESLTHVLSDGPDASEITGTDETPADQLDNTPTTTASNRCDEDSIEDAYCCNNDNEYIC